VEKLGGRRALGKTGCRWEDNTKVDSKEIRRARTGLIWLRKGAHGKIL
jgi:hypothetical protein